MKAAASPDQALDWALAGGDDYELLFAVHPKRFAELEAAADRLNLMLTAIGELSVGAGVTWSRNGKEFVPSVSVLTTSPKPRPKSQFRRSHTSILVASKSNDALLRTVTLDQHSFHQSCESPIGPCIVA